MQSAKELRNKPEIHILYCISCQFIFLAQLKYASTITTTTDQIHLSSSMAFSIRTFYT